MIEVTFPDGRKKEYKKGITGFEIVSEISEGLARSTCAMKLNDIVVDINTPLTENASIAFLTFKDDEGKEVFWHTTAHIFAQALLRLYPEAKIAIGPPIESGFHYDFALSKQLTPEDFGKLEEEMKKIVKEKYPITKKVVSQQEALDMFPDNKFKQSLITEKAGPEVQIYTQGEFDDFCKGPHLPHTGMVKALKLTKISGAYWKGNADNEQLQRVYGISFPDKKDLKQHLERLEEAAKRDHRKITKDLNLVYFHEQSPGNPFFLPKGTIIYNELVNFIREQYTRRGYDEVITPQVFNQKLWETSGHWDHYKDDMFLITIEGHDHSLKPMNCPSHCLIYNRDAKSYKDLPVRIADFGPIHRNELSGTLTGLSRVRKFSQDDGHIFCRFDQIGDEVHGVLEFIKYVWEEVFDFKLTYYLSTRPEKALGDKEIWDKAESLLKEALDRAGITYGIKEGDGAFYGPKIDIDIEDALGRRWQCPTCQLDFNLPERFETDYMDENGEKKRAVMIHRAILGSVERFFGIMLEHYAGKLPLWISPVQVKILPIADRHINYCKDIADQFRAAGLRPEINTKAETTSKKVREAQLEQVNYIIVIGDQEVENKTVNVRTRDNEVLGEQQLDDFIQKTSADAKARK